MLNLDFRGDVAQSVDYGWILLKVRPRISVESPISIGQIRSVLCGYCLRTCCLFPENLDYSFVSVDLNNNTTDLQSYHPWKFYDFLIGGIFDAL